MTTNKNYLQFKQGVISPVTEEQINQALLNVRGRHTAEGRALLIALFYTGGRPNEVLRLKARDITKEGGYIKVVIQGSKGGLPRTIYLPYKKPLVKQLYKYACAVMPEALLFYHYQNRYIRQVVTKRGVTKERLEISSKLRYYLYKWFAGVITDSIPPYYLRHSRLSSLAAEGADMNALRMFKGSKTYESITPYLHMSSAEAKKLSKKIK